MSIFGTNVLKNRDIDRVIVLGSGMSILDLTKEEKEHINSCKYVIAFNKFMAFYKKAGVLPTHIYFHDRHDSSINFFRYILKICRKDNLCNLTFFTNNEYVKAYTFHSSLYLWFHFQKIRVLKNIFKKSLTEKEKEWTWLYKKNKILQYPKKSILYSFNVSNWLEGGKWAASMQETIFHYRGSLTSVLNVCSILFPSKDIFLVGTDFNTSSYFFEDEINLLNFTWKDWTYDLVKEHGMHFSYQSYEGKRMEDAFPYIIKSLSDNGNDLYCTNSDSLLVKSGVKYKPLIQ